MTTGTIGAGGLASDLEQQIKEIANPWVVSAYYGNAEKWTYLFWDQDKHFRPLFDELPRGTMLELACGYGRHAERAASLVEKLILVDVIEENLAICRTRLGRFSNVEYRMGSGAAYPECNEASIDSIYCYDAMVHFSPDIVEAYLNDTARVLRPGGRALFHHSNYAAGEGKSWAQNPNARNFMTVGTFARMAAAAGLYVVEQRVIPWGGNPDLDGITLLERPTARK